MVYKKDKDMLVISTREFREKQGAYLVRAKNGEDIILKSRENGSFKLVPVTEDDTLMSKEDFLAKIDKSLQQAKEGKVTKTKSIKELKSFLDSL